MTTSTPSPTPLAAAVRAAREARGWSRRELAARACCSAATISRIESGRTTRLWGRTRQALALILGADPMDLAAHAIADAAITAANTVCDDTEPTA